jgi:hypothetical protein
LRDLPHSLRCKLSFRRRGRTSRFQSKTVSVAPQDHGRWREYQTEHLMSGKEEEEEEEERRREEEE